MRTPCILLALGLLSFAQVRGQSALENVIVEKYYISDANDAADTDGGTLLEEGSVTYRVLLDMGAGCKLRGLFGDTLHPFIISSTAVLYNNNDRGDKYGHGIDAARLDENTVALDSWLSLGDASDAHTGVLKADDSDGSIVGGANNDGGSEGVPEGLLVNASPDAGIAITIADGLAPSSGLPPPGFLFIGDPLDALNDENSDSAYSSQNMIMQSPAGIAGYGAENKILVAQITTTGDLAFQLNVEIIDANGDAHKYVASGDTLAVGETEFGLLNYPPACGCMDPNYLEYDPAAGCDDGSCQTTIVFGCLDELACNYDPTANFNVLALCCYGPGNCNGLDLNIVCPDVAVEERVEQPAFDLFPNPAHGLLTVQLPPINGTHASLLIHDRLGRLVYEAMIAPSTTQREQLLDLSALAQGMHTVRLVTDGRIYVQGLVKQ